MVTKLYNPLQSFLSPVTPYRRCNLLLFYLTRIHFFMAYKLAAPFTRTYTLTKDVTAIQWLFTPIPLGLKFFRQGRNLNALNEPFRPYKHTIRKRKEHTLRNSKSSPTNRDLNFTVLLDLAFLSYTHRSYLYKHSPSGLTCQVKSLTKSGKILTFSPPIFERTACFLLLFSLSVFSCPT